MRAKKKEKLIIAKEYWTRHWHKEPCHPHIVNINIVLFSHKMPSHAKKEPAAIVAMSKLEAAGVVL